MNEPQFWYLSDPESTVRLAEWVDDEMDLESIVCPAYDGHQRAGRRLTNLSIALRGRTVQDFVWTWYSECLIQDHVLELFRKNNVTGFEVKPVKAVFKRKTEQVPPRLWEIIVTGWAGMAQSESGVRVIRRCNTCGLVTYSGGSHPENLIDASEWDGNDFFMVWPLPKYRFVTERVARLIRDNRLTGANFKPIDAVDISDSTFSGGQLSWYMPEARARELGEPLGIY